MRPIRSRISALFAGSLLAAATLCAAPAARAQITGDFTFDTAYNVFFVAGDATIDGDLTPSGPYGVYTDVVVGKDNAANFATLTPLTPITLTITGAADGSSGAAIDYNGALQVPAAKFAGGVAVYGNHIIQMEGGYAYWINAHETSGVNMTGGYVPNLLTYDTASASISGGYVDYVFADDSSTVDINGGSLYRVYGLGSATVTISNTDANLAMATESSSVTVDGGALDFARSVDDGVLTIASGTIADTGAFNNGIIEIDGGSLSAVVGHDNSLMSVGGGTVDSLSVYDANQTDIFAGSVNSINVFDDATVNLYYDTGLDITPQSSFTEYNSVSEVVILGTQYQVTGDLLFGDTLNATVKAGDYTDDGLAVTFAGPTAAPDLYVTDSMTVGGAYNSVVVGSSEDDSVQTSPVVTVAANSFVRDVFALNGSDVTVNDSTINRFADAYNDASLHLVNSTAADSLVTDNARLTIDNSQVGVLQLENSASATLNSGHIDTVTTFDQTAFTILGGDVNYLYPSGGTINVAGGAVFALSADVDSQINVTGGATHFLVGYDQTQIAVSSGVVDSLNVNDEATASLSGGDIPRVFGSVSALIDISGGNIGEVQLRDRAAVSMTGGTLSDISLLKQNVFAITGGRITDAVFVYDLSEALITGAGLTFSAVGDWLPAGYAAGTIYSVSGFWNDGLTTPFSFLVYSRSDPPTFTGDSSFGTFTFGGVAAAPEPATWALLLIGLLCALAYLRRRNAAALTAAVVRAPSEKEKR